MDQVTDRLPGVIAIHNDIHKYTRATQQTPPTTTQNSIINGLVFNSKKCHISKPQIIFYGTIFSAQGMKPDHIKIQALQDLPTPQIKTTTINPRISQLPATIPSIHHCQNHLLREQVSQWGWTPSTDRPFQQLRQWICNIPLKTALAYYDRTQPLTMQTDVIPVSID